MSRAGSDLRELNWGELHHLATSLKITIDRRSVIRITHAKGAEPDPWTEVLQEFCLIKPAIRSRDHAIERMDQKEGTRAEEIAGFLRRQRGVLREIRRRSLKRHERLAGLLENLNNLSCNVAIGGTAIDALLVSAETLVAEFVSGTCWDLRLEYAWQSVKTFYKHIRKADHVSAADIAHLNRAAAQLRAYEGWCTIRQEEKPAQYQLNLRGVAS